MVRKKNSYFNIRVEIVRFSFIHQEKRSVSGAHAVVSIDDSKITGLSLAIRNSRPKGEKMCCESTSCFRLLDNNNYCFSGGFPFRSERKICLEAVSFCEFFPSS